MKFPKTWLCVIPVLIIAVMLGGCAKVPVMQEQYDLVAEKFEPKPGKGNIYVVRSNTLGGAATVLTVGWHGADSLLNIDLNGRNYGSLARGTYILFELDPGHHVVSSKTQENVDHEAVDVVEGDNYFVEIKPTIGLRAARVSMERIDAERGKQLVIDGKRVKTFPLKELSRNKFISKRGWFSLEVPTSSNWANVPFAFQSVSVNQTDAGNYDAVTFLVDDFGEVLFASVRRIPDVVLEKMEQDDHRKVLSSLAYKALDDWRGLPVKPTVVEETYMATPHGESILRVYMAEKGSLLRRSSEGRPTAFDTFDTLIAVIVAKKKNYYVYAIAENDFESSGTDKNKQALKQRAQSFFESIVVHQ